MYNKNLEFIYDPIGASIKTGKFNFGNRGNSKIKYIVVHDTGNKSVGANAKNHKNYVQNNERRASAHYFVDDKEIRQFVGDSKSAYSVGDGHGKYGVTNSNSLNVEMCINSDSDIEMAFYNTVELVKNLMVKFNVDISHVIRHYDASRKICPASMSNNNWTKWWKFKELLKEERYLDIDLEKNSVAKVIKLSDKKENSEVKTMTTFDKEFEEAKKMKITDGTRENEPATRKEVAVMFLRGIKKSKGET